MGVNISPVSIKEISRLDQRNVGRINQTQRTIRWIRERLGFSQEEFAQWLGLSVANVMHWETGNVKPTRMTRRLIFDSASRKNRGAAKSTTSLERMI